MRVSDSFWSNTCAISSRSRQKGLQYAVEGYIQHIKISHEGETMTVKAKAYKIRQNQRNPMISTSNATSTALWTSHSLALPGKFGTLVCVRRMLTEIFKLI